MQQEVACSDGDPHVQREEMHALLSTLGTAVCAVAGGERDTDNEASALWDKTLHAHTATRPVLSKQMPRQGWAAARERAGGQRAMAVVRLAQRRKEEASSALYCLSDLGDFSCHQDYPRNVSAAC